MKKTTLALALAVSMGTVAADGYVGLYGITTDSVVTGAEVSHSPSPAALVFGTKTKGDTAIGAELFFANQGLGGAIGIHQKVGGFTFSLGKLAINDNATGTTPYGAATDSKLASGGYFAIQHGIFSIRYMEYGVNHTFTGTKRFPHPTKPNVFITKGASANSSAERRQLWVGIQRNF